MAKRHALVRRAVCVENIGRVSQICTDKTGTITIGQLELTHIDKVDSMSEESVLRHALIASNIEGSDPVDYALVEFAKRKKIKIPQRTGVIPFTEDRKQETGFYHEGSVSYCTIKGSPEVILSKSKLSQKELVLWSDKVNRFAKGGHKVLAVASIVISNKAVDGKNEDPQSDFLFNGLLAFEDPPRPEIKDAINYCHENGIKVLMITGDHPVTASAIAKDVGITSDSSHVASAEDLSEELTESWLRNNPEFLKRFEVIARCTPIQKLHIVEALKNSGEIVVVTGDGVNDVPALKAANIGVAMGLRGTKSAKEVSSIILADDNFSTIVNAIREGKQLYSNLRMSFKYLLLIHIPFILSAALIPLMGYPLLYLPIHVVWLELIIHPTALFAFQQYSADKVENISDGQSSFFNRNEFVSIVLIGLLFTSILILSYISAVSEGQDIGHGRAKAMALLSVWSSGLVMALTREKTLSAVLIMIITIATSSILIQSSWPVNVFHLSPLHLLDWLKVCGIVLFFIIIIRMLNVSKFLKKL